MTDHDDSQVIKKIKERGEKKKRNLVCTMRELVEEDGNGNNDLEY